MADLSRFGSILVCLFARLFVRLFLSMFEQVKVSDRESSIICAKEAAWAPCRLVTFPFCRSVFGAKLATG